MIKKIYKAIYSLKRHERMLKVPRQYANPIELESIDDNDALIMGRSHARSPANVRSLLKANDLSSVDELIDLLPDAEYTRRSSSRFLSLLRGIEGTMPNDPDVGRMNRLKRSGYIGNDEIVSRMLKVKDFE